MIFKIEVIQLSRIYGGADHDNRPCNYMLYN